MMIPGYMKVIVTMFAAVAAFVPATAAAQHPAVGSAVERIYILRSVRLSRVTTSEYCSERRTGFPGATFEDRYEFKAVAARSADGAVTNAAGPTVGHLHACLGATSDSLVTWFYAQGDVIGIQFTGHGDCRTTGRQVPEPGITPWSCYLDLTALPDSLGGGQLTTNTVNSRAVLGLVSDPPGYAQPSIATVRLWRKRVSVAPTPTARPPLHR